jgi:phage repressor protein C with HTH and peptisase S24 domain
MISITKISGDSMSPVYCDGDYVFCLNSAYIPTSLLKKDRDYIIEHRKFGTMIKRLTKRDLADNQFHFTGLNQESVSAEQIGALPRKAIKSLIIHRVKKR